jgi:uncharacterized BrkB/YihY/UPF0761 family membrane protein
VVLLPFPLFLSLLPLSYCQDEGTYTLFLWLLASISLRIPWAFVFSILQQTPFGRAAGSSILFSCGGLLGGLIASYLLFQVIYLVVPNQKSSFRQSWPGSVVAAVLLELYLALFPLYVTRFLGVFFGALSLLILLI